MSSLDAVIFVLDKSKKTMHSGSMVVFLMTYSAKRTSVNRTIIDALSLGASYGLKPTFYTMKKLLRKLKKQKVKIDLIDGRLDIKAPAGVMTEELLNEIKSNKESLSNFFLNFKREKASDISSIPLTPAQDDYAVSSAQHRLWVLSKLEDNHTAYNMPSLMELSGDLEVKSLNNAFKALIERHESLRTVFVEDTNGVLRQRILSTDEVNVQFEETTVEEKDLLEKQIQEEINYKFDLEKESLIRIKLFKTKSQSYILSCVAHHIICDEWSMEVMKRELFATYHNLVNGIADNSQPLNIQYKDYTDWQNKKIETEAFKAQKEYWLNRFSTKPPVLNIPTSEARPAVQSFNGKVVYKDFDQKLSESLKDLSQSCGGTLFMGLLTAAKILLFRYSNQKDITIGSPILGREHPDLQDQIGLYVNTVGIRTQLGQADTFKTLFTKIKEATLEAYQHQEYPFDELVAALKLKRDLSRNPLFDVMLTVQDADKLQATSQQIDGLNIQALSETEVNSSKFDLEFTFLEKKDGIRLELNYNTDIFEEEFIQNLTEHFEVLLNSIVQSQSQILDVIDLLTAEDKVRLLEDFSNTDADYPKDKTIAGLFTEQALKTPKSTALLVADRAMTYQDLEEESNRLANYLRTKHKIKSEQLVGVKLDRDESLLIALLAVLKTGAAYVPIDPTYPESRIRFIEEDSKCKVTIDQELLTTYQANKEEYSTEQPKVNIRPSDLAYVIYTSGSTGKPKGVMLSHANAVAMLSWAREEFKNTSFELAYAVTSHCFDLSVFELFYPLSIGKKIRLLKNGLEISDYLKKENKVLINTVPSVIQTLTNRGESFEGAVAINMAGEPVPLGLTHSLPLSKIEVRNLYGPSEDTTYSSCYRINERFDKAIPIGKPVANTKFYILSESLELQAPGLIGELYISGRGLSRGYLNRPELTEEKFLDNPFKAGTQMYRTGDIARWFPDGNMEFLGRKDNQIKVRGYRIELGEIEHVLLQQESIDAVSVAIKEVKDNKAIVAYVVEKNSLDKSELREHLSTLLPTYMIPNHFVTLETIPMTPNGKVDRKALPEIDQNDLIKQAYEVPQNATEKALAAIWEEMLGVEKIGRTDNFFELGGHSLIINQVINKIRTRLGKSISLREMFMWPTIKELSQKLTNTDLVNIPKADVQNSYPLSPAQERLWMLSQLGEEANIYHIQDVVKIKGTLNVDLFETAIKQVINRHEVLRTGFRYNEQDEIRQYVFEADELDFELGRLNLKNQKNQNDLVTDYLNQQQALSFDLESGQLLRATVISLDTEEFLFFFSMHHIIADGFSLKIATSEIVTIYNALLNGTEADLPSLDLQYKDYTTWLKEDAHQERQLASEKYWLEQFAGDIPVLELSTYRKRPKVITNNGAAVRHSFSKTFLKRIKDFSAQQNASLFMTLMAGVNALLHRYTGQDDLILGTPIAGREHPDLEQQIGLYLNTLAIRTRMEEAMPFSDLMDTQKSTLLEAYQHQGYSFDQLVDKLNLERDTSRNVLFDVMLVLQNQEQLNTFKQQTELDGLEMSPYDFKTDTAKFDLTLTFQETDSLDLTIEYNTDIYDETQAVSIGQHLENLLIYAVENPQTEIKEINYLSEAEVQDLLINFNKTEKENLREETIVQIFERQAREFKSNLAVVCGEKEFTFQQLNEAANQLAYFLRKECQVLRNDLVVIKLERNEELIMAIMAILKAGAAYVPVDIDYPQERIDFIEKDCNGKVILDEKVLQRFYAEQADYPITNPKSVHTPEDLAYVIYTSGTTGKPKGVMVEHRNLRNFIDAYDLTQGTTSFTGNHVFDVSVMEIFCTFSSGGTLCIPSLETVALPEEYARFIHENQITHCYLHPMHIGDVVATLAEYESNYLKRILVGTEPIAFNTIRWFLEQGVRVVNGYGPTESTVCSTFCEITSAYENNTILPIGTPLSNLKVYLLDDNLNLVTGANLGTLYVSGKSIARGYLNRPELTEERFIANPFVPGERMYNTGDICKRLADGNLEYAGRSDDQVKIAGHRIELGEIANCIKSYQESIRQVVVLVKKLPHGNVLQAYFVSDDTTDIQALREYLGEQLPGYMIPARLIELEEIPLTTNGKTDKRKLLAIEVDDQSFTTYVAPKSSTEKTLAKIWQEILGKEKIGLTDNFFELGGHSLLIAKTINRMKKEAGKTVSFKDFFVNPSIGALSRKFKKQDFNPIPLAEKAEDYPLTSSQFRFWLLCQMEEINIAYNIPFAAEMIGQLELPVLRKAFSILMERHETLRTEFLQSGTNVRQVIVPMDQVQFDIEQIELEDESMLQEAISTFNTTPFDLAAAPLLRVCLIKVQNTNYLCFNMHHIIGDGQSLKNLVAELSHCYNNLLESKEIDLPVLNAQFKDYAVMMQNKIDNHELKEEQFWLKELAGALPILNLPTWQSRPPIQTYNGASVIRHFDQSLVKRLNDFSQTQQITNFIALVASMNGLFYRYTNQTDIILGTPVSGREHPDLENQIGLFINTIPLRTQFDGADTYEQLISSQKETCLNAYENSNYPFGDLVNKLELSRDTSRSPIFDILVIHQKQEDASLNIENSFSNLDCKSYDAVGNEVSKFDMTFTFIENGDQLTLNLEYNTDLYKEEFIKDLADNFEGFMQSCLDKPKEKIAALNYLDDKQSDILINVFNKTQKDYDSKDVFVEKFAKQVSAAPDKTALVCKGKSITYRQLDEDASRLATHLKTLGISPNDTVGICLNRSIDMLVGIIAVLKSGASYLPLDPFYPIDRIDYILEHSKTEFVLCNNETEQILPLKINAINLTNSEPWKETAIGVLPTPKPDSMAYVIYTSGSTGRPKGVKVSHQNLNNFIEGLNNKFGEQRESRTWLAVTSISFDISILELLWSLTRGDEIILHLEQPSIVPEKPEMNFSLFYFPAKHIANSSTNIYELLLEGAKFADENNFEAIWVPERHFHNFGDQFPNPSVAAAAVSTITKNISLRSGSVVLPLHDPVRVAEEWSMVDNLSNGRVELSIASGWHPNDFVLAPDVYKDRHQFMRDNIQVLQNLWQGETLTRKNGVGQDYEFAIHPRPIQKELPIWVTAAGSIETFKYAGSIGANLLTHLLGQSLDELEEKIKVYRATLKENGFDPTKKKVALMLHTFVSDDAEYVREVVEEPFKNYLRNSFNLLKPMAEEQGMDIEKDLEVLLDMGFHRFYKTGSLFGTPESCLNIINKLFEIDINEIACLIDFGVEENLVIDNFKHLGILKELVRRSKLQQRFILNRMEEIGAEQSTAALIKQHKVTHLQSTPSFYEELLLQNEGPAALESIDTLLVGGEALRKSLAEKLLELRERPIFNMYGPTETTIWSAIKEIDDAERITIGSPMSNTQIYILDKNLQLCPIGVPGDLYIGGDGVSMGYLNNPEMTDERYLENPFSPDKKIYKTGDVARWLYNGEIEFLGRIDSQVKVRGYRIELEEIENSILKIPEISQCVVSTFTVNEQVALTAYIITDKVFEKNYVKDLLRLWLPNYMIPQFIITLDTFPKTPNGKIDVKKLPHPENIKIAARKFDPPRNQFEEDIATIWANFLRLDRVGIEDNFFEIGGNSMKAFELVTEMNKAFSLDLTIVAFFQYPTIRSLADSLSQEVGGPVLVEDEMENVDDLIDFMNEI